MHNHDFQVAHLAPQTHQSESHSKPEVLHGPNTVQKVSQDRLNHQLLELEKFEALLGKEFSGESASRLWEEKTRILSELARTFDNAHAQNPRCLPEVTLQSNYKVRETIETTGRVKTLIAIESGEILTLEEHEGGTSLFVYARKDARWQGKPLKEDLDEDAALHFHPSGCPLVTDSQTFFIERLASDNWKLRPLLVADRYDFPSCAAIRFWRASRAGDAVLPDGRFLQTDDFQNVSIWEMTAVDRWQERDIVTQARLEELMKEAQTGGAPKLQYRLNAISIGVIPDGKILVACEGDGLRKGVKKCEKLQLSIWSEGSDGEWTGDAFMSSKKPGLRAEKIAFSSDKTVAVGYSDGSIEVWSDISKRESSMVLPAQQEDKWLSHLEVLPGNLLVAGHSEGSIRIWKKEGESWKSELLTAPDWEMHALQILKDGTILSTAQPCGIRIWKGR